MRRVGLRKPRRRPQHGQSLAEFALVAPIFFLLVFAVVQLGLVMAAQNGLVDGVRTAARRAATYRINEASFDATVFPAICAAVKTDVSTMLSKRVIGYSAANVTSTVSYEWVPDPGSAQYFLVAKVSATYRNPLYVPLVSYFLDSSDGSTDGVLSLKASEQMRVENPALNAPASTAPETC